jgi:clan AA aspartic protease
MGLVVTEIELVNTFDEEAAEKKLIGLETVKRMKINALVDSGAFMLCINETIKNQLGLRVIEQQSATLADGSIGKYDIVGPVTVKFENRLTICTALVLPGNNDVLLGAIPMEAMDLLIHPKLQKLMVNPEHPYMAQTILKKIVSKAIDCPHP